jgi:hypothetical protein
MMQSPNQSLALLIGYTLSAKDFLLSLLLSYGHESLYLQTRTIRVYRRATYLLLPEPSSSSRQMLPACPRQRRSQQSSGP